MPATIALGLPGGVALALALAEAGGATALLVGALAGAVALGLAGTFGSRDLRRPTPWAGPTLAPRAWRVVATGPWGCVGGAGARLGVALSPRPVSVRPSRCHCDRRRGLCDRPGAAAARDTTRPDDDPHRRQQHPARGPARRPEPSPREARAGPEDHAGRGDR